MQSADKKKIPLIVIAGPTAVGKTDLSLALAAAINGEIISGDSMQVYKGLDIGTAKIKEEEMQGIRHHIIDILNPDQEYNVSMFQSQAKDLIRSIHAQNKYPIVTGGTGLYIDALVYDYQFTDQDNDNSVRDRLWKEYEQYGHQHMVEQLRLADPASIVTIDIHNIKRIIRALEVTEISGRKFSELEKNARLQKKSPYQLYYFVLTMNRSRLYDRINKRVDLMLESGWINEVRDLLTQGRVFPEYRSVSALGYREVIQYLHNEMTYEVMAETIKQETRRFAKRQLTWFRKNKDVVWIDKDFYSDSQALSFMLQKITE